MTAAALMVASRAMKLSACSSIVQGGGGRGAHSVSSGLRAQRTNRGYLGFPFYKVPKCRCLYSLSPSGNAS
jgi:hypothetical protein